MGNASGKYDGEGTSGATHEQEGYEQSGQGMEFAAASHGVSATVGYQAHGLYAVAESVTVPSHTPSSIGYPQASLSFTPRVPIVPLQRHGEIVHDHCYTTDYSDSFSGKPRPVMIAWHYGGKQVAVTGSWDNWEKRESLQRSGKDFITMKMLASGVYHYRFIVDQNVRHAPDLPREYDALGNAYNVLDVPEYDPEAAESLSEFELPPSPDSSYNNESLRDNDFGKPPPDMPPHIQFTPLNDQASAVSGIQTSTRPDQTVLNHLYIQHSRGQPVALGSTHRFRQKYVTVILYKPSRR